MKLTNIHSVYFIGIGGIGMSALARYFNHRNIRVAGYDRTATPLTKTLEAEGMTIRYEEDVAGLPKQIDLVVYTPAIPAHHSELTYFRANNFPLYKRSQVLGLISENMKTIAIAGTHGKTTTTTLTTHLLRYGQVDCSAFLGGVARNFGSNFVQGNNDWVVVEADEFDRSFLTLYPDVAVILSMDADHLDIYGDEDTLLETGFLAFASQIKAGGTLLVRHGLEQHFVHRQVNTFGIGVGDIRAEDLRVEDGYFVFDYTSEKITIEKLQHPHPGKHNVENALVAITVALDLGVSSQQIREGLLAFKGIGRRFEFLARTPELTFIDDYAHHPTELKAAIGAAKMLYPEKKITGIFQPHLYSRTRDFATGFAEALDMLDEAILLDIYPAREEPIPGVSSKIVFEQMKSQNKKMLALKEVLSYININEIEVLLTLGAGNIDTIVQPLSEKVKAHLMEQNTPS